MPTRQRPKRINTVENTIRLLRASVRLEAEGLTQDAPTRASDRAREIFGFEGSPREIYLQLDGVLRARAWERRHGS